MTSLSSIAQSGLSAAQTRMDVAAHNTANLQTEGFKRQRVEQQALPDGGTRTQVSQEPQAGNRLEEDVVNQISASYSFEANLQTIRTQDRMMGSLLNEKA